eukprot:CAMPEP_0178517226 /NCGR_PEP_ID=MMETSP0696-20121128/25572_1 /TAXON_ID=265572 /ORGANISM="Extubocellulus spinifer, Strain CCMP396" /LENGTH=204 /DNA_ID=CAMNT_0020147631 /DNA_START=34 /DNA_END=648 /DNA_ORIENTATION=-
MKTVAILALAGSAAAFAPAQTGARSSMALSADLSKELGAMTPLGFFDPLQLCKDGSKAKFDLLRERELKHGRVSMLAVAGYLTTAAGIRFPGAEDIPDGLAAFPALQSTSDGMMVLYQMAAFFVMAEICNRDASEVTGVKPDFVGDYRNGALDFGWDKLDDETKLKKRTIELNNGRAAMMGIWGLVTHEIMGVSILPGGYLPGH